MPIIGAYAMPHPPLAVPGVSSNESSGIAKTLAAFDEAAREIERLAPETIVFITPHSVLYSDYFHISPGRAAKGDMSRFNAGDICLEAEYDEDCSGETAKLAGECGLPAGYMGEQDPALDHGVFVPMWFINQYYSVYKAVRISQSGLDPADHYRLGQLIARAAENTGHKTVLIASGDLSHKLSKEGPYGFAPQGPEFDAAVTKALGSGDFLSLLNIPEDMRDGAAECGYNSFVTLAGCFDGLAVTAKLLSYEGPYGVGYAVASFKPGKTAEGRDILNRHETAALDAMRQAREAEDPWRALARMSLECAVKTGNRLEQPPGLDPELLHNTAGVFVSLYKKGRLRGCIGTITPTTRCVAAEIIQNAVSSGLHDDRFEPVTASELPYLTYKVDVLFPREACSGPEELDVKKYGVIVYNGNKRGLLLPNLEGVDTVEEQLRIARQKAGILPNAPIMMERFRVVRHE
jgi:AmmeMemoRadiSam system protein A